MNKASLAVATALAFLSSATSAQERANTRRYTLVVITQGVLAQFDYTGADACLAAIETIRSQFDQTPRPTPGGGVIIGGGPPMLFCVPR